jgi:hypothetical protein
VIHDLIIPFTPTDVPYRIICGEIDGIIHYAMRRVPQPWFDQILCHGNVEGNATPLINGEYVEITPEQLAQFTKQHTNFGNRPIMLLMCWVGKHADGFAQKFANLMQVPVLAPPCEIDTDLFQCNPKWERFRIFWPQVAEAD